MSNFDLNTFTFNGHTLRTMKIAGEPWLVAVDVLRALDVEVGTKGTGNNLRPLDDAEKRLEMVSPLKLSGGKGSGPSRTTLISESGFYKLTMRAQRKNPAARAFQDWVTKEVLPALRKDGMYVMGEEKLKTGELTEDEMTLMVLQRLQNKVARLAEDNKVLTDEWSFVTVAEFVATNHVYLNNNDRARLAGRARRIAAAEGIKLQKSPRTFNGMNGPIETAVNIYPRGILDKAATELNLFEVRKLDVAA